MKHVCPIALCCSYLKEFGLSLTFFFKFLSLQTLWSELFLRWVVNLSAEKDARKAIAALKAKDVELRQKAGRLRRQLADLEKEVVESGILPERNIKVEIPIEN